MSKIKLTKGELKRQRDSLKQFRHYLPTLQLKKQQLQLKIAEAYKALTVKKKAMEAKQNAINQWAGVLADSRVDITPWITPKDIVIDSINITGSDVPVFKDITFQEAEYDYYSSPLWIDKGISAIKDLVTLQVEVQVIEKEIEILKKELRITTQRVNLFEKVKIPECIENIRVIRIYLGDQMANAVGISKVAKKKIELRTLMETIA